MQSRTIIDRIEIEPQTGNIGVLVLKQVLADDGTVLASQNHRTMIAAGTDPAAQMAAANVQLGRMGYPAVKAEDIAVLDSVLPALTTLREEKVARLADKAAEALPAIG